MRALALPPPEPPRARPSASPAPVVAGAVLPYGSPLEFVLENKIDSRTTAPGTVVHLRLRSTLAVNGVTIAPAGTPGTMTVLSTRKAASGDEDGAIAIHLDPLAIPGRATPLPVRANHEFLTVERSGGELATRDTTDTVGDIFIPFHVLYHVFRSGRQMVLPEGAVLRAQTAATIDASDPHAVVFSTPPPFASTYDVPHADLTAAPLYTPAPNRPRPLPKGKPTLPPTPGPSPSTADSATPAATPGAATPGASAPGATASPGAARFR